MTVQANNEHQEQTETVSRPIKRLNCTACGSSRLRHVVDVPSVPAFCNVLLDSAEAAAAVKFGDIELTYCEECSFLFNAAFDASVLAYSPEYANSLSCSPSFGSFLQEMSERLVEKHELNDKTVLELGCGDGDFLVRLCTIGNNRGFGFDPSYFGPSSVDAGKGVTFEVRYYGSNDAVDPNLVCSRHVLEHVEEPEEFVRLLAGSARPNGAGVYIEVPNATYMLEESAIWDLIYEHPGYFTDRALVSVAEKAGLRVTEARATFHDQFLYIDAESSAPNEESHLDMTTELETLERLVSGFRSQFDATIQRWNGELDQLAASGKRVVTWGAGSKGVTFLNLVNSGIIDRIVDINPGKHGRFVPGSGQIVVSPESLAEYQPDLVLLMNGAYKSEVVEMLLNLNVDAKVTVVD